MPFDRAGSAMATSCLLDAANPLVIPLSLRHQGQSMQFDKPALAARFPRPPARCWSCCMACV